MKKLIKTGISFLSLLLTNRPKVYWFSLVKEKGAKKENFGDIITPYLVKKITGIEPVLFYYGSKFSKYFRHYIMVGSIIGVSKKKTIIWGSGIIKEKEKIREGRFIAVRGPRTQKRLKELGYNVPNIVGDPGLLLSKYYNPKIKKTYKIGLVSHYVDFDDLDKILLPYNNILHIDLMTTNVEDVIDQILSCDKIISTSLHGIITAHSYNIPALWWKYSNKLSGDDIKFYDYFESVNLFDVKNNKDIDFAEIIKINDYLLPNENAIDKIKENLLTVFPF